MSSPPPAELYVNGEELRAPLVYVSMSLSCAYIWADKRGYKWERRGQINDFIFLKVKPHPHTYKSAILAQCGLRGIGVASEGAVWEHIYLRVGPGKKV